MLFRVAEYIGYADITHLEAGCRDPRGAIPRPQLKPEEMLPLQIMLQQNIFC